MKIFSKFFIASDNLGHILPKHCSFESVLTCENVSANRCQISSKRRLKLGKGEIDFSIAYWIPLAFSFRKSTLSKIFANCFFVNDILYILPEFVTTNCSKIKNFVLILRFREMRRKKFLFWGIYSCGLQKSIFCKNSIWKIKGSSSKFFQ